ncbi:LAETG motif-containing sortase-dependent surface protein [Streptomyces chiangmaiensis]|uniref:LAETG motif-containing sortase-dependent surface protein n=1 Tax=Streptomyces chiangmaiensis TaxID=766497 RepID=A0ABU7FN64_9ACTN|nr:LAETG motif-containing sortase-dependent surface protein [Streptomyces chiangmaiensis]MED7825391.1 LAETG motif-containing sortase-dependent surface protein [Streptomyces chiangmaiensis]
MSVARHVTVRRLLVTGAAALTLTAVTGGAAWAGGTPGGDGWNKSGRGYASGTGPGTVTEADHCQFSLDGSAFTDSVRVDDQNLKPTEDGKVHIKVRVAGDATTCTASLASYRAHGATFNTSGLQVFHDFDSVTVERGETGSLDISVPDAGCFAQIDLYRGKVKFDGNLGANDGFEHGDLPKGPDRPVIKDRLIASWNGGTKDCTTQPPSTPGTTPPASTPPASVPATTPPASTPASPSASASTPPAAQSSAPAAPTPNGGSSTAPGGLAETGGGGNTLPIAAGAAALVVAGAGIAVATRRRTSRTRA